MKRALFILTLVVVLAGYHVLILQHAPGVFAAPEEDMSYAWYVPLFSLYLVWRDREAIRRSLGPCEWNGVLALLPFLLIGFLGVRGSQIRFEIVGFAGTLVAAVWAFYGRPAAARILFPAAFLLFCMPLTSFLDVITVHLRLLASASAEIVMRGFGVGIVRHGTALTMPGGFAMDVVNPCSGLRSLFAMTALTAGYAYLNQPTWTRRALLFATSVPYAILGNVARIVSICIAARLFGNDFANGFYHDYSGYVVFLIAVLAMLATSQAIDAVARRKA